MFCSKLPISDDSFRCVIQCSRPKLLQIPVHTMTINSPTKGSLACCHSGTFIVHTDTHTQSISRPARFSLSSTLGVSIDRWQLGGGVTDRQLQLQERQQHKTTTWPNREICRLPAPRIPYLAMMDRCREKSTVSKINSRP